jgi:hypothetical protein
MRGGRFLLGLLVLAAFAAVVIGLVWRSPAPTSGQPPSRPPQERTTPAAPSLPTTGG